MSLPEPLVQGDLARTPFAHLLMRVSQRALTGSLIIWDPDVPDGQPQQDRILFSEGLPVAAVLRESASRLDRGLLPLFGRTEGPYAFYGDADLVGDSKQVRTGRVAVLPLIAASLRGSARDDAVDHVLSAFGDERLRLTSGVDLGSFGFLPEERGCVDLLRAEPMPLSALIEISPLDARTVRRLVYLLGLAKAVEPWDGTIDKREPRAPPAATRATKKESKKPAAKASDTEPPPPPSSGLSSEHRELWEEVVAKTAQIETQNYFDMLGVLRDVKPESIQKAYFGLVKKWHPDRLPAELKELRPFVERIFTYLTRAQETLCDDEKRGPYLSAVLDGGGTPEADRELGTIIGAAMDFQKVEVLMRRHAWVDALELLDSILGDVDEEADYHATRGYILYQMGADDPPTRSALRASLDRAIELSENHDRAHYYLGLLLKRSGQKVKALEHFRIAAKANPKNIEAVREVRIASMRGGGDKGAGKGSFFGKLFGGGKKK